MTEQERNKIIELRHKGFGYKKISNELPTIALSSIRYVCNESKSICYCKQCGIRIKSIEGKKKKEFCSTSCRIKWWNKHLGQGRTGIEVICKQCGKTFRVNKSKGRIFCSQVCYQKYRGKANAQG